MKKLNTALVCIISVGIIVMAVMSYFFREHTLLLYNIRELRRESGIAFICPITELEVLLIIIVVVVVLVFNIAIIMHRKKRSILNKIIIGVVAVAGLFILYVTGVLYLFLDGGDKFFCFYSSDEKHSIIAYEISPFIREGYVILYERTSPVTIKQIGKLSTGDCMMPISNSECSVTWRENAVEFTVADGAGGTATEIIDFENANHSQQ